MEKFKGVSPHRPIGQDAKTIRIVHLLPGQFGDPIECRLEHVNFHQDPKYEAISYCWGNPLDTTPILLDGKSYDVSLNLFKGLQYLRRMNDARYLWIDSLCINQSDDAERSREIRKMGDIYRLASQVLIWLGDYGTFNETDVQDVFDFVAKLAEHGRTGNDQRKLLSEVGFEKLWHKQRRLGSFLQQRPWFERMWIIQEVCVRPRGNMLKPQQSPQVICGRLQMPFIYLVVAYSTWVVTPEVPSQISLPPVKPSLIWLKMMWISYQELLRTPLNICLQLAFFLTITASRFKATDQRDNIYATLGLLVSDSLPDELIPDYSKPFEQVFTEYAGYILNNSGLIDIIQCNSGMTASLPSWVPDWKCNPSAGINSRDVKYPGAHIEVINGGNHLEIDLMTFTCIEAVCPKLLSPDLASDALEVLENWIYDCTNRFQGPLAMPESRDKTRKSLWGLFLCFDAQVRNLHHADVHSKALHSMDSILDAYRRSFESDPSPSSSATESIDGGHDDLAFHSLWDNMVASLKNKHVFRCVDGSYGVSVQSHVLPEKQDAICSIKGACAEFIVHHEEIECGKVERKLLGRCRRTVQGFGRVMGHKGVLEWATPGALFEILQDSWASYTTERVIIS